MIKAWTILILAALALSGCAGHPPRSPVMEKSPKPRSALAAKAQMTGAVELDQNSDGKMDDEFIPSAITRDTELLEVDTALRALIGGGGSMAWPGEAGIAVYGGSSAWGASLTLDTDASTVSGSDDSVLSARATKAALDGLPSLVFVSPLTSITDGGTTTVTVANLYPVAGSTTTATGEINIDGVSADHYYFHNGATAASYTAVITSPPAAGKERAVILTIGGGAGICTLVATNITWLSGTAPTLITTTNKRLSYACLIPASGNAQCAAIGGAHD